jgi:hypothetical protein
MISKRSPANLLKSKKQEAKLVGIFDNLDLDFFFVCLF